MDDDGLLAQPHCPHCRTVLRDTRTGYECAECDLLFLPSQL